MKVQTATLFLMVGSLTTSISAVGTVVDPQNVTRHQATAELNGPGWRRLLEYLEKTETDNIEDPITVRCVLAYFMLGQQCREFCAV